MGRVQIATQGWGVVTDRYGNSLPNNVPALTKVDGTAATVYTTAGGTTPVASLVTDSDGRIPGYLDEGSYTLTVNGIPDQVEATLGRSPRELSVTDRPFQADPLGATDSSAAFTAALTAVGTGGTVRVPAGAFKVNSPLTGVGNVTIDIDPGATINGAALAGGNSSTPVSMFSFAGSESATVPLTANANGGDTTLTVAPADATALNLSRGDIVHVSSSRSYTPTTVAGTQNYPIGELSTVDSVSSGTITLVSAIEGGPYQISISTTLNGAINGSVATITLASVTGLATTGGLVTIDTETIYYAAISGNNLTNCIRGVRGTVAASHLDGAAVNQNDSAKVSKVTMAENITVRGGMWQGANDVTKFQSPLNFKFCRNVRVENIRSAGFDYYAGAAFDGCIDFAATHCSLEQPIQDLSASNGYGFHVQGCSRDGRIESNYVHRGRHGMSIGVGTTSGVPRHLMVTNNVFSETSSNCLDGHGAGEHVSIIGNTTKGGTVGIDIRFSKAVIQGNKIIRPSAQGIWLRNQSDTSTEYTVTGNSIKYPGSYGIYFANDAGSSNALVGTAAGQNIAGVAITGNEVHCLGDAANTSLGVYVFSNATLPFSMHHVAVVGNIVHTGNIRFNTVDDGLIVGNRMSNVPTTISGIRVDVANRIAIVGNSVSSQATTTAATIRATGTCTNIHVASNQTAGSTTGLTFDDTVTNSTVVNNDLSGNTTPVHLGAGSGNVRALNRGDTVGTYTVTNLATDRTYDATATTTAELANVLGSLIADLRTQGLVA